MSEELHSLSGAYVLDALDEDERRDFEVHLERCDNCREEVASLREVTPLLAETVAVAPPPALRDTVLAEARTTRQERPPVQDESERPAEDETAQTTPGRHRGEVVRLRRRYWVALAAAAALVVGGGVTWQIQQPDSVAEQVVEAPDAHTWRTQASTGGTVTIIRSEQQDAAVLQLEGVPDPGEGKTYQAWLQQDGSMVPAGTMAPAGTTASEETMVLQGDVGTAAGVGLTVEPEGGSQQPTTKPVALVELG